MLNLNLNWYVVGNNDETHVEPTHNSNETEGNILSPNIRENQL